jgi:tetrahydromethanopterin S-methyltransferase subunit F
MQPLEGSQQLAARDQRLELGELLWRQSGGGCELLR